MADLTIVSRKSWGAKAPTKSMYTVALAERVYLFAHYLGAEDAKADQAAQLRGVQAFHQGPQRNWADIGYNFAIGQDGTVYEARGRDKVGAHCPNFNRNGIGVLFLMGDDDQPSDAAKRSFVALRDHLNATKGGEPLKVRGHRDGKSTACPGDAIYNWLKAGTPVTTAPKPAPKPAATKPAPAPAPKPAAHDCEKPPAPAPSRSVRHGCATRPLVKRGVMNNSYVRDLQSRLNMIVDGDFGPNTERKVKQFQAGHGLAADGLVGQKTWHALGF